MKLSELIKNLEIIRVSSNLDADITGIAYDSRTVKPGDLFVTWRGSHIDGRAFLEEALNRGAVALCVEEESPSFVKIPYLVVRNARTALADLAKVFYADPGQDLIVIGVTGTNGKTTVSYLVESVLQGSGYRPGLLGTIHYKIGDRLIPSERTTPESLQLQKYFKEMLDAGCRSVVMEVSSHALHQGRVKGIDFDGAVFTNLSQDHLDYHQTFEEYFKAKSILFEKLTPDAFAVINIDDPYGARLVKKTKARVVSYGCSKKAMIWANRVRLETTKSSFEVVFPQGKITLEPHLIGNFNVYNVLAAFSVAWILGINPQKIKAILEVFSGVSGRMEFVPVDAPFQVIVDYAHTDDALQNVLNTLRPLTSGRLITVFGCGGDRDRTKRFKMGEMAGRYSDLVIVTTDNPRSENPSDIAAQIEEGLQKTRTPFHKILDRKSAIEFALRQARTGDSILIAGKGHEKFQEIGFSRIPFDDVTITRELCHAYFNMKCELRST